MSRICHSLLIGLFALATTMLMPLATYAQQVQLQTQVQSPTGQKAKFTLQLVEGSAEAEKFLADHKHELEKSDRVLIIADIGAEALNESIMLPAPSKGLALVDIREKKPMRTYTKSERIESLIFATFQTVITTTSFLYVSKLPTDPAVVSAMMAGFFNFYFNWDIERWNDFLSRSQVRAANIAARLGFKNLAKSETFEETAKTGAGYVGAVTFATFFAGVGMWDQIWPQLANHGHEIVAKVFSTAFITFALSQPFDSTFSSWLKKDESQFLTRKKVKNFMRVKTLLMTIVTSLLYADYQYSQDIAQGVFLGGMTLTAFEHRAKIGETIDLSWSKIRDSTRTFIKEKVQKPLCNLLMSQSTP